MKTEHFLPETGVDRPEGGWWISVHVNLETQRILMNYHLREELQSEGFFEMNEQGELVVTYEKIGRNTNYNGPYVSKRPDFVKLVHDWYDYIILGNCCD